MSDILSEVHNKVGIIRLNRPEVLNAMSPEVREVFEETVIKLSTDPIVKVIVITGRGRAFCSGGDIKSQRKRVGSTIVDRRNKMRDVHRGLMTWINIEKPVIAAVNGPAIGLGFSLAMAADICIASDKASFSMAFSKVGLVPDYGGIYFITQLIGINKVKELVFTGKVIDAREAIEMGIVNRVVPHEDLEAETMALAIKISDGPSQSYALSKTLINKAQKVDLVTYLEMEAFAQSFAFQTKDHAEGVRAFLEKRQANFSGE